MSARPGDMVELEGGITMLERPRKGRSLGRTSCMILYLVVAEAEDNYGYCWLLLLGGPKLSWVHEGCVDRRWLLETTS